MRDIQGVLRRDSGSLARLIQLPERAGFPIESVSEGGSHHCSIAIWMAPPHHPHARKGMICLFSFPCHVPWRPEIRYHESSATSCLVRFSCNKTCSPFNNLLLNIPLCVFIIGLPEFPHLRFFSFTEIAFNYLL